jgi:hypothetical protein
MDQKNTIVKCAKHKCLFNKGGTCDQYVITIGVDNTCQAYTETEGFTFKEQKVCHPDCIHFDDSDIMVGPICLFKHPEPLKEFYEGMPCEYYHSKNYTRGQRAKGNIFDDTYDVKYEELFNATKNMLKSSGVEIKQEEQMCWYCDHGKHGKCTFLVKPMRDSNGECCRFTSTGGNR